MRENKRVVHVLIAMCMLFFSLIVYLTYFEVFVKDRIITSSYNRRQWEVEDSTVRGRIYDCYGMVLADSCKVGNRWERVYPFGNLYSQVLGYNSRSYGRSLLEASYNNYLLDIGRLSSIFTFNNKLSSGVRYGNNIYLTINHDLQTLAYKLLGDRNGAVVAMNPQTGEILAMVSKPDYDPNSRKLSENWQEMVESKLHPFVPRATQGLYTPGSTFKIVTSAAALENGFGNLFFEDEGNVVIDGKPFSNTAGKAYGRIDLKRALAVSSNVYFAQIGVMLGSENLSNIARLIGMNEDIPFDIPVSRSRFPYKTMEKTDMAAASIGQGKILVTPLHMAMITSSVANKGVMMKPFLVKSVVSHEEKTIFEQKPSILYTVMSPETAEIIKDMMREVVESGTGKNAAIKGVSVAGKTGTAENELTDGGKDKQHAWFVALAPVENPQIVVAVILEYSGSTGGKLAAPVARQLISAYLSK